MSQSQDFSQFYEQWFDRVYGYARHRTGSATKADEIAADTFTRALKSWERFDAGKGDRQTWLFSIAFRAVADHYRGLSRSGPSLETLPEPLERAPSPAEALERSQELARLTEALTGLEDQAREIVALKFFGRMTNRAIAGVLGLTESNVAVILFRSVRKMRKSFPVVEADHG
jgi:RNA polymerase sigma-70 factor, ECF subfamily